MAKEDARCGSGLEPRRLNAHDQRIPVRRVGQVEAIPLARSGQGLGCVHGHRIGVAGGKPGRALWCHAVRHHVFDRDKAIPAANAIAGQKATNLLVVDSSQEGVSDAEAMLDQILLDMKVPTTTVDVADENAEFPALNHYSTIVVAIPNLDRLGEHVLQIMQWAKKGGGVMFAMTPEKTGYLDVIGPQIGIESSTYEYVATEGITPSEDFMLGGSDIHVQ